MPYTYDTDRAPLWVDSRRMELDEQAQSLRQFSPTQPAPMDAGELRRDAIAAAAQAPRIPRNRPIVGTSQQGRVIRRAGDIPQPTEPVMTEMDWVRFDRRVLYPVCVLALLACAAAVFDVRWTDAMQLLAMIGGAR
jgi:hypothetical protein